MNRRIWAGLVVVIATCVATALWEHHVLWSAEPYGGVDRPGFIDARQQMFDRYLPIISAFRAIAVLAIWRALDRRCWAYLAQAVPLIPYVVISAIAAVPMLAVGIVLVLQRRFRLGASIIALNLFWALVGLWYFGDWVVTYWD